MMRGRVSTTIAMLVLSALLLIAVGCTDKHETNEDIDKLMDEGTEVSSEDMNEDDENWAQPDNDLAPILPKTQGEPYVIFGFEGENLAYHTGLLNQTPILLRGNTGWTKSAQNFEETTSLGNRSTGVDRVDFSGSWDGSTLKGELVLSTVGTTVFAESEASNEFSYDFHGTLEASLVPGTNTLEGTVTGSSLLAQNLSSSEGAEPDDKRSVTWTITGEIMDLE